MSSLAPAEKKLMTIQTLMESPSTLARFRALVPQHLTPDRMVRLCLLTLRNPKLAKADPTTLLGAFLMLGSLGLEPNTTLGQAYLIPFENKKRNIIEVNMIVGYRGLVDLARRSGNLVNIHADVVYEGDEFSFEYGSTQHLRHRPSGARNPEKRLWAYAYARLTDGESFEVMPYSDVLAIRNRTQGYSAHLKYGSDTPWTTDETEMAKKTAIRRLAKTLSLSPDFARAVAVDAKAEAGRINPAVFAETDDAIGNPELATIEPEPDEPTSLKDKIEGK